MSIWEKPLSFRIQVRRCKSGLTNKLAQNERTYSYTTNSIMLIHELFANRFVRLHLFGAYLRALLRSLAEELSLDITGQVLDEYQIDLLNNEHN